MILLILEETYFSLSNSLANRVLFQDHNLRSRRFNSISTSSFEFLLRAILFQMEIIFFKGGFLSFLSLFFLMNSLSLSAFVLPPLFKQDIPYFLFYFFVLLLEFLDLNPSFCDLLILKHFLLFQVLLLGRYSFVIFL